MSPIQEWERILWTAGAIFGCFSWLWIGLFAFWGRKR
jgi:hypothetical protein